MHEDEICDDGICGSCMKDSEAMYLGVRLCEGVGTGRTGCTAVEAGLEVGCIACKWASLNSTRQQC
jgi:hypothetical protein